MPDPTLRAAVFYDPPGAPQVPAHRHGDHELVLVVRGRLRVAAAGVVLAGAPGTVHVFPAGTVHDQGCTGPWRTLCLLFSGTHPLLAGGPRAVEATGDGLLADWFHHLHCLGSGTAPEDHVASDGLLAAVLARLSRHHREGGERASQPPALAAALAWIDARLDRDLDVGALATAVGLSRSHLGELFRRYVGAPPLRHHARLRLQRARSLLANPYASVSAVARELGYADLNWFVRRFRAEHGVPPGRWRATVALSVEL